MTAVAAFAISASGFAADPDSALLSAQVKQLTEQTQQLEKEVHLLQADHAKQIQYKKAYCKKHHCRHRSPHHHATVAPVTQKETSAWHQVTVTTTAFNGRAPQFDGADLLYNAPTMNEDLVLLQQKQALVNEMFAQGETFDRPILQLSGSLEGALNYASSYHHVQSSSVTLTTAEIDFNAIASPWATGFMALDYDGSPVSTGNRAPNSRIYVGRGFVTVGNLNVNPFYFTAGKIYLPFGRYANSMVSTPLTESMGRILTPAVLLGFQLNDGLYGSVYGFTGDQTSGPSDIIKQEGVNAGYKKIFANKNGYSVGLGWVSNIADSQGMQNTGYSTSANQFGGFGVAQPNSTASNDNLRHAVDGGDVHARLILGRFTVLTEYLEAMRSFDSRDLSFNNKAASPSALHSELDYLLPFIPEKYGTSLGVMYGRTWQALALNLPEQSYAVYLNTSIWQETTESIEFRHNTDYASTATGSGEGATTGMTGTGKDSDSIIAEVGMYF